MASKPLTSSEQEDLRDLLGHSGAAFIFRFMEELVEAQQREVLQWQGTDEKELFKLHAGAKGAQRLLHAVKTRCEALKPKKES